MLKKLVVPFLIVHSCALSFAHAGVADDWLEKQHQIALRHIKMNISPADGRPGAVLASPSRHDPDYYYHWVRDAALVMDIWMRQLEGRMTPFLRRHELENMMWDFVDFTVINQASESFESLGEPKYYVSGQAFLGPWGRPQNDGPALRASVLMRFANYLLRMGHESEVRQHLWPVIEQDLNYVGREIHKPSFDLWEEIKAANFYTRLTGRAALRSGAAFAARMGDPAGAAWLNTQADLAQALAEEHLGNKHGVIFENIHRTEGIDYKNSGLDIATVLAVLHTQEQPWLSIDDGRLAGTVNALEDRFYQLYPINQMFPELGVAFGRYPEDRYFDGNPWFLTTLAVAEYYYLRGNVVRGDKYMARAKFHADQEGRMAEQINRFSGYMLSAHDLTWSYAAFLTAYEARKLAKRNRQ
jgi:glucoamylase